MALVEIITKRLSDKLLGLQQDLERNTFGAVAADDMELARRFQAQHEGVALAASVIRDILSKCEDDDG